MILKCKYCGEENSFDQPNKYHAGFSNVGFIYNDTGNLTLIWSTFDRDYTAIVGDHHPWTLNEEKRLKFEQRLKPSPKGGKWSFINPARCNKCKQPISDPIFEDIYYLVYPNSIKIDLDNSDLKLKDFLQAIE